MIRVGLVIDANEPESMPVIYLPCAPAIGSRLIWDGCIYRIFETVWTGEHGEWFLLAYLRDGVRVQDES